MNSRTKNAKKSLEFYRVTFGIEAPYKVLMDGPFAAACLAQKLDPTALITRVIGSKASLVITRCGVQEAIGLQTIMGETSKWLLGLPRFKCVHKRFLSSDAQADVTDGDPLVVGEESSSASNKSINCFQCLSDLSNRGNPLHFIYAVHDPRLVKLLRDRAGTPVVLLSNNVAILAPPSAASERTHAKEERRKLKVAVWEKKVLDGPIEVEQVTRKRKSPAGPNPLSAKKRKIANCNIGGEKDSTTVKKKRTRSKSHRKLP